jgi:hypothetical protein
MRKVQRLRPPFVFLIAMSKLILVFDCESIGLYGETFAVGAVVLNNTEGSDLEGKVIDSIYFACPQNAATGGDDDRQWISKNIIPHLPAPNCSNPAEIRDKFWLFLRWWQELGADIWVDCGAPVETNFLRSCVADNPIDRTWKAPYPLHEIATALLLAGENPICTFDRLPEELPAHHPTNDARQSARILQEILIRK